MAVTRRAITLILVAILAFFLRNRVTSLTSVFPRNSSVLNRSPTKAPTPTPAKSQKKMFSSKGKPIASQPLLNIPGDHFHKQTSVLTFPADGAHTASVIFVHGLGDSGNGWIFLKDYLSDKLPYVKWIFPTAPYAAVTVNGGMKMNSWFDIHQFGPEGNSLDSYEDDDDGMLKSSRTIMELVKLEVDSGIPSDRIVIGGFSQGAIITCLAAITSEMKLAGQVSLSGRLPLIKTIHNMTTDHTRDLPIFWGHGKADPVIKYIWAEMSVAVLKDKLKMRNVEFIGYEGVPHSVSEPELDKVGEFMLKLLPPTKAAEGK